MAVLHTPYSWRQAHEDTLWEKKKEDEGSRESHDGCATYILFPTPGIWRHTVGEKPKTGEGSQESQIWLYYILFATPGTWRSAVKTNKRRWGVPRESWQLCYIHPILDARHMKTHCGKKTKKKWGVPRESDLTILHPIPDARHMKTHCENKTTEDEGCRESHHGCATYTLFPTPDTWRRIVKNIKVEGSRESHDGCDTHYSRCQAWRTVKKNKSWGIPRESW